MSFIDKSLTSDHMKKASVGIHTLRTKLTLPELLTSWNCNYLRKAKDHYANLDEKYVADNKHFWRTVKPLLSDKVKLSVKITLVEGEEIIKWKQKKCRIFSFKCS